MVGLEVDSRTADSPPTLQVIARVELPDANNGNVLRPSEMVYYERSPAFGFASGRGGKVFACGSVNYVQGLVHYTNGWTHSIGAPDPVATTVTRNVLDRLGCRVDAPAPRSPADLQTVDGVRALVEWQAASAQRIGIPVHYTLCWQVDGFQEHHLDTDATSAWVTALADAKTVRWRVGAVSECGETAWSSERCSSATSPRSHDRSSSSTTGTSRVLPYSVPARANVTVFDVAGGAAAASPDSNHAQRPHLPHLGSPRQERAAGCGRRLFRAGANRIIRSHETSARSRWSLSRPARRDSGSVGERQHSQAVTSTCSVVLDFRPSGAVTVSVIVWIPIV
jgi:hypothetical protein